MQDKQVSHPLSQAIYEGVLEQPPWKTLLKSLEEYMQVASATLVLRRPRLTDPGLTVYLYSDSHQSALRDFSTKAYLDSPLAELPEKKVFSLNDRVTRSELESLKFHEFLKDYHVKDLLGFDVYDKQSQIRLRLRIVRLADTPAFSRQDRARLQSIVPLMHNALKLYAAYTHNSFVEEFYQELLGSMGVASVILNAKLEVLSANREAKQILAAEDCVYLRGDRFRCQQPADQDKLTNACRELISRTRNRKSARHTRSILLERSDANSKWDVHIRIVEKKSVAFGEGGPELVLLLQATERDGTPSEPRLIEMFGVTPAEAKLIPHLSNGLTLTAAAKELGVSRNTARAQLASIFTKTGVHSQTQLVKLVADAFAKHWQ